MLASPATALVGIALDGRVTRWSAGAEELLGWRADEVLGQPLPVVQAPNGQGVLDLGGRLLTGEDVPNLPFVHLHRDGSLVTVQVHLLVVRDLEGLAVGLLARYDDPDRPVGTVERDELRLGFLDSPVPQWRTDRDGTVLAVNRAMERLLGLPAARLVGTDSLLICVEPDRDALRKAWDRLAPGDHHHTRDEVTLVGEDGQHVHVVVSASSGRDPRGRLVIATALEDVTARGSAERLIRREYARYASFLESMPIAVFTYDQQGRCTSSRGQAVVHFGLQEGELDGVSLLQRWRHQPRVVAAVQASLEGELTRVVVDAAERVWQLHYGPVRDEQRRVVGGLCIASDMTELAIAEREVRNHEGRLRALLRESEDVVFVLDEKGRLLYVSAAITRVLGYDDRTLFWHKTLDYDHPDDRASVTATWRRSLARPGTSETLTCRVRHADGSWRVCEHVFTNLLDDPDLRGVVVNVRDVTERHRVEQELERLALHDALTGLANRPLLLDRVRQALVRDRRSDTQTGLIVVDVKGMRAVNEKVGQVGGDVVLRVVAERLLAAVRAGDSVARVGGDEFAVLMGEVASLEDLRTRASSLVDAVRGTVSVDGLELEVSLQVGCAMSPAEDAGALLVAAERALPVAGAPARGVAVAQAVDHPGRRHREQVAALRRAISGGELRLHYQPVMQLPAVQVAGVEALVRWQHPERGLLAPAEFIPLAESSGLVRPLGEWVLRHACAQAATWHGAGAPFGVGINLSPLQMVDADVVELVRTVLAETGARPEGLVFEVTESALMDDPHAPATLRALQALGVRIALDDFGTGYSSLTYLKRFAVDAIKIDRSFVAGLGRDADDEAIVSSVVSLSRAIGKLVIAEGVETVGQLNALHALGVDQAQGFLWSPALPADELERWIAARRAAGTEVRAAARSLAPVPGQVAVSVDDADRLRIVELHGKGASLHTIAAALNAEGRRTPTGPRWTTTTVARVVASLAAGPRPAWAPPRLSG